MRLFGLRIDEVLALSGESIDLDRRLLWRPGYDHLPVPIPGFAVPFLEALRPRLDLVLRQEGMTRRLHDKVKKWPSNRWFGGHSSDALRRLRRYEVIWGGGLPNQADALLRKGRKDRREGLDSNVTPSPDGWDTCCLWAVEIAMKAAVELERWFPLCGQMAQPLPPPDTQNREAA